MTPVNASTPVHSSLRDQVSEDAKRSFINTILEHCNAIYLFASRYSTLSNSSPQSPVHDPSRRNPPPSEMREMTQRAQLVLDLVDRIRGAKGGLNSQDNWDWVAAESKRARFEDPGYAGQDAPMGALHSPQGIPGSASYVYDDLDPEARSEAERDMLTIRSKRSAAAAVAAANAGSNSNVNSGVPMSGLIGPGGEKLVKKTRKRGRTPLPGKCHSCNIRETPEWRRGPDGARTLCNACGLHYAKLVRKRDKALTSSTAPPPLETETRPVDMDMVRASTQQRTGVPGSQFSPSTTEPPKGHYLQQLSPGTHPDRNGAIETAPGSANSYTSAPAGALPSHDSSQIPNPAYSISSYSSLTPQRSVALTQNHAVSDQIPSWDDNDNGSPETRYARGYRPTTSDERGCTL